MELFELIDLKMYSSREWIFPNSKKYRNVYEKMLTDYIYAELSFYNLNYRREDWEANIKFIFFIKSIESLEYKEIGSVNTSKFISNDFPMVYIREGWGNKQKNKFWKKGEYKCTIELEGIKIIEKFFYVEDGWSSSTTEGNPYFEIDSIKLFESDYEQNAQEVVYTTEFTHQYSRYIYTELNLKNKLTESWVGEFILIYEKSSGEIKGINNKVIHLNPNEDLKKVVIGWGSNNPGSWFPDEYKVKILFLDKLLASESFIVV